MKRFFLCIALLTYCSLSSDSEIGEHSKICVVIPCTPVREAIVRKLKGAGFRNIVAVSCPDSKQIQALFQKERPEYVILDGTDDSAPSRALLIDTQALYEAKRQGVKRCLLLSSFAIYPEHTSIPFKENLLFPLQLKDVRNPYAIAKIAALKQCHEYNDPDSPQFIVCPYPYLYGTMTPIEESFNNPVTIISRRINQAKQEMRNFALVSNDGRAKYELLHINDLAAAVVFLMQSTIEHEVINIGVGHDISIKQIADCLYQGSGYKGELIFDCTEFDDVPRRVLDSSLIQNMGWSPVINTQTALRTP